MGDVWKYINTYPTTHLAWQNKPQNDVKWGGGRRKEGPLKKIKTKVTIKALKEIPHGFGVLKYFLCYFFVYFKRLESIRNTCKLFESLHGQFRVCQQQSDVLEEVKRSLSLWRLWRDTVGEGPQLSILYWTAPQRAVQHSQTRHCYLGGKGPWNFRWLENTPALVSPDTPRGQAYDTEELWLHLLLWTTLSSFLENSKTVRSGFKACPIST